MVSNKFVSSLHQMRLPNHSFLRGFFLDEWQMTIFKSFIVQCRIASRVDIVVAILVSAHKFVDATITEIALCTGCALLNWSFQVGTSHQLLLPKGSSDLWLSGLLFFSGILCAFNTRSLCPIYAALWATIPFLDSIMGIKAAKLDMVNEHIAHVAFSLVALALCVIGIILSAL